MIGKKRVVICLVFIQLSIISMNSDSICIHNTSRGNIIIVDINNTGQYNNINDALESCIDGDIIKIKRGTYNTNMIVDKRITLEQYSSPYKPVIVGDIQINTDINIYNISFGRGSKIQINDADKIIIKYSALYDTHLSIEGVKNFEANNNNNIDTYYNINSPKYSGNTEFIITDCSYQSFHQQYSFIFKGENDDITIDQNYDKISFDNVSLNGGKNGLDFYFAGFDIKLNNIKISNYTDSAIRVISELSFGKLSLSNSYLFNNGVSLNISPPNTDRNKNVNILLENNNFSNNKLGIMLGSIKGLIKNNLFLYNERSIKIIGNEHQINGNTFKKNNHAISFGGSMNRFYSNILINNSVQASYGGTGNKLFNNYEVGGNYWSDYSDSDKFSGEQQTDKGSDGFGDNPYYVTPTFYDKYPIFWDICKPIAIAPEDEVIDEGSEYILNSGSSIDDQMITKAEWKFLYNNTVLKVEGTHFPFSFNPGEYSILMTVFDYAGNNDSDIVNLTVRDIKNPIAKSQGNIIIPQSHLAYFDGSQSYDTGKIILTEWIFSYKGENQTLLGVNVNFLFDKPGIIPVLLRVTDTAGHSGEVIFTVTVKDFTNPTANAGDDFIIDNGEMANFDGSLSNDNGLLVNYNWTFNYYGQNILLEGREVSYPFEKPGNFNIFLEVTDQFGNSASDNLTLTVRDTKDPEAIITGLSSFLESENIRLSGKSSTDNGEIVKYEWVIMDNGSRTFEGADLDYKVEFRGYHHVTLTVYDVWGNHAETNTTVNSIDGINPFTYAGPDQEVAIGTTVNLDGSQSHDDGTITNYEWSFNYDGQKQEKLGEVTTFKFDKAGEYEVTLKVYDDNNNYGIDTVKITVKDTGDVQGTVKDGDGKPVKGALVEIVASDGKTYSTETAPDGQFSIAIPPGSFTWRVSKDGYQKITGSGTVAILGETNLDLTNTPMKKVEKSGLGPILFIVPVVAILIIVIGLIVLLMMRKKKPVEDDTEEGDPIPSMPAEGDAEVENPTSPPIYSEFTQVPPRMEDGASENIEENNSVDDLLRDH